MRTWLETVPRDAKCRSSWSVIQKAMPRTLLSPIMRTKLTAVLPRLKELKAAFIALYLWH
jgi:hypothetical protein